MKRILTTLKLTACFLFILYPGFINAATPTPIPIPTLQPQPTPAPATDYFLFTVQTTSNYQSVTIWADAAYTYNYCIDKDNNGWDLIYHDSTTCMTYPAPGTYTMKIGGVFPHLVLSSVDAPKVRSVEQWGKIPWRSMESAFYGCSNLVINATDAPDLSNVTSMQEMFAGCTALNQSIDNWNTSTITNMSGLFFGAANFNQDISDWNTGNVTEMNDMFAQAYSFNQPLGSWNTAKVTTMSQMFYLASAFDQDISTWNMEQVTSLTNFLVSGKLSTAHYDALLIGWNAQNLQNGVAFHAGNSNYSSSNAISARSNMDSPSGDNWTITDGGMVTATPTSTVTPTVTISPTSTISRTITATVTPTREASIAPDEVKAYPNPAKDKVTFLMDLTEASDVSIALYNLGGERVAQLTAAMGEGQDKMEWDCASVSPGVYIAKIKMGSKEKTVKVAIAR